MNVPRMRLLFCVLLSALLATASAQQVHTLALGNQPLAKRRSREFLAERGIAPSTAASPRYGANPAQMLAKARAQYHRRAQPSLTSGPQVPIWQPIGPAQVITSPYGAVAGRVTSLAADPSDATGNTVYVGTAFGGVWKSTNAAGDPASVTFVPLTDSVYSSLSQPAIAPSLSIGAISVQPVAPGATPVILAGTGIANDTTASYFGSGVLRSTDGGNQWSLISSSTESGISASINLSFIGDGFAGFAWGNVLGNPVVVAAVSQVQQGIEVNAGLGYRAVLGIYYSTNEGQTWSLATITDPGGSVQSPQDPFLPCGTSGARQPCGNAVTSIVWNPVRNEFYAAVRFHGYYQSSDGQNWTRLPNQPGANLTTVMCPYNTGLSGSQACPIYNGVLAVQPVTGDTFALTTDINNLDQGLWQDTCNFNSGSCASPTLSFTQIPDSSLDCSSSNAPDCAPGNSQPRLIPQADYDLYLAAVPAQQGSQPDTLLFAGTADIYRCDMAAGCAWRNTTHAQSFDCNSAHVAPAQYAVDATFGSNGLLYFGNDGGLWRSTDTVNQQQPQCSSDDAAHFQNLNPGFTGSIAEVEDLAPDAANPQNMMLSLGTLGTAAPLTGSSSWQQVLDGEGDYAAIDPVNPQNWYATSEFGVGINRCPSGTSCNIAGFGLPVIDSFDVGDDGNGQIIPAPWILDPQDSSNLILGTCRVWRGPASGGVQTQLSTMLDGDNGAYCNGNAEIRSIAASGKPSDAPGTPEQIYAGMAGLYDGGATVAGHIFTQSVNSSSTPSPWIDLSNNLNQFNPDGFDISSINVDPHSQGGLTIYATLQGFGSVQLYQSNDGGSIWQNISANLPIVPANSVVVDPNNANTVYLATDAGVYYTQNVSACSQPGADCWSAFGTSLPNVPVTQLTTVNGSTGPALLAATYGRGVWQIGLANASAAAATVTPASLIFASQPVGTTSASQQLQVTNTGTLPLQISTIAIAGDFTENDTCAGQSIVPGDTCVINVSYAPTKVGAESGLLTLYGNLPGGGQRTVPLSGTGLQGAPVTLTPNALCFAPTLIGQTSSTSCQSGTAPIQVQSIVVANTGSTTATLSTISITGDFAISANTCGSSLAPANTPNDSCTLNITFTPSASGNRTGILSVISSAGTLTAQLVGTGQTSATDTLTPLNLNFPSQTIGSKSAPQQITLINNGDQALQTISVQASTTDFAAADNCGATLAGHSSCAIQVTFLPTSIGTEDGTITVSDVIANGLTASPHTQNVSLTGTGVAPAGIASAAPLNVDFGYFAVGGTDPNIYGVTVTNSGTSTITGMQTAITGDFATVPAPQNPCGAALPAGTACNFGVSFSPSQVNARAGSLTVTGANLPTPLVVSLTGTGAAFNMQVSGSSSQVITGSETVQPFQIQIDSVQASTGPVNLTCAVVPASANCAVLPQSVTLTGNSSQFATVSFTVTQQARVTGMSWGKTALALALLVPVGFLGRRRRWCSLVACLLLLLLPVGCGISSSEGSAPSQGSGASTPTGQYTITLTGSMPASTQTGQSTPGLTQTLNMQVSVQ